MGKISKKRKKKIVKYLFRILLVIITAGGFAVLCFFTLMNKIYNSGFKEVKSTFVSSVMETNNGKFLAEWFLSEDEIERIITCEGRYDPNPDEDVSHPDDPPEIIIDIPDENKKDVELITISSSTYTGKLLIISDPSRIKLFTSYPFDYNGKGYKLEEISKKMNALAVINASAFEGVSGDVPLGLTICNGETLYGDYDKEYCVVGFDFNNKLIVGKMNREEAESLNLRDAVAFSPMLVKDGVPCDISKYKKGLNPHTAIGQRQDGAVLLLVVDGRQPASLGASYQDLINIMLEYGAVNACNLDGGSSSVMIYENEAITNCCSLYGAGRMATAFYVTRVEEAGDNE